MSPRIGAHAACSNCPCVAILDGIVLALSHRVGEIESALKLAGILGASRQPDHAPSPAADTWTD